MAQTQVRTLHRLGAQTADPAPKLDMALCPASDVPPGVDCTRASCRGDARLSCTWCGGGTTDASAPCAGQDQRQLGLGLGLGVFLGLFLSTRVDALAHQGRSAGKEPGPRARLAGSRAWVAKKLHVLFGQSLVLGAWPVTPFAVESGQAFPKLKVDRLHGGVWANYLHLTITMDETGTRGCEVMIVFELFDWFGSGPNVPSVLENKNSRIHPNAML